MGDEENRRAAIESFFTGEKKSGAEKWEQKRRLAGAMRLVIERLVPSNAPEDELRTAADQLERYAEHLKTHPRLKSFEGFAESALAGDVGAFFDQSPFIGLANPLAPPITITKVEAEGQVAEASVVFGSAYEGPPGCVHGGFVAAAFDEVLGFVQSTSGNPGFTGTLTVRYRVPTPLHTELRFHGEITRSEGRKTFASGTLHAGDTLCAEAEAIFVAARPEKYQELRDRRAKAEENLSGGS